MGSIQETTTTTTEKTMTIKFDHSTFGTITATIVSVSAGGTMLVSHKHGDSLVKNGFHVSVD